MNGVGNLVAAVTAAGLTIYVLGLIGLATSITLRITNDFSTAWYAVSLLPRTVVAGQGTRLWLSWPFVLTFTMVSATLVIQVLLAGLPLPASLVREGVLQVVLLMILAVILSIPAERQMERQEAQMLAQLAGPAGRNRPLVDISLPIGGTIPVALLPTVGTMIMSLGATVLYVLIEVNAPWSVGILIIFFGSLSVGARAAMAAIPPLPTVAITMKSQDHRQDPIQTGRLVTHSDAFWHLFDEGNELVSIPDERVLAVRTVREADTPPAEGTARTEEPAPPEVTKQDQGEAS